MHKPTIDEDIYRILATLNNNGSDEPNNSNPIPGGEPEHIYVYIEPDRMTIIPEPPAQVIEAVHPPQIQPQPYFAYITCAISLLLVCYLVTSAFVTVFFPPTITVTLLTKSQTIKATGTLQLQARQISPITLSESQTVPTTGRVYQPPVQAKGAITFYNGEFQSVTIPAGKAFTGSSGVTIITDQNATIPAANLNPPTFGQVTVSAHAINPGSNGNIAAYDINEACCAQSVLAKNPEKFYGGQDERTFQTVAKNDIEKIATPLNTAVTQSMQGALQGQLKPQEHLQLLPCAPTVTSDHAIGEEAKEVKITVSETCSAVAYNREELDRKATDILTRLALHSVGTGYSLIGKIQVSVKKAAVSHTPPTVFLSFAASGTWIFALSPKDQEQIKKLIAGKRKQAALHILLSLPGVKRAEISGIDDLTKLPKSESNIHFVIMEQSLYS